jgi:hypothetical protein
MTALLLLTLACRVPPEQETESPDTEDSETAPPSFEMLVSSAGNYSVQRLRFVEGEYKESGPEVIWTWEVDAGFETPHRPHGLSIDGDRVLVSLFEWETDAYNVALDLETGALLNNITTATGADWGGTPERDGERSTHNIIADPSGDGYILSDTHNHRILGIDESGLFRWEISQSTIWEAGYVQSYFANPNDVELVEIDGEPRLQVSCRGDSFNQVLWFKPAEALRPGDPPWELERIYPPSNLPDLMLQNHNPLQLEDGSGFVVANSFYNRVDSVNWDDEVVWSFPGLDCDDTESFKWPRGFLWTPWETLLVGDTRNGRLVEVDPKQGCLDEGLIWSIDGFAEVYDLLVIP